MPESLHKFAGDSTVAATASPLVMTENGARIGPAHTSATTIEQKGGGTFCHWATTLYFSASDNSEPNSNGRSYQLGYPVSLPVGMHVAAAVLLFLLLSFMLFAASRRLVFLSPAAVSLGKFVLQLMLVVVLEETVFWVLTTSRLSHDSDLVRGLFRMSLDGEAVELPAGLSPGFREHHYLNYVLNPDTAYLGVRQYNSDYLIRRTEPLRPRGEVRWRALAIGGSTTFGDQVVEERDTWVHQLEDRVRAAYGQDCDVINGGVGGYTLAENFLHYCTLLTDLEPDVVLLYVGINDVHPRFYDSPRLDYSHYRVPWRYPPALPLRRLQRLAGGSSFIGSGI